MEHNQFSDMDEDEKKAFLGHIDAANTKSARSVSTSLFYSYMRRVKHFVFKRNTSVVLPTSVGKINLSFINSTLIIKLNKSEFL